MAGPGRAPAKILYFVSGRAGLRLKFQFSSRAGPGSGRNFSFPFGPGRAWIEILISLSGRAGPGPKFFSLLWAGPGRDCSHAGRAGLGQKNLARADLYATYRRNMGIKLKNRDDK